MRWLEGYVFLELELLNQFLEGWQEFSFANQEEVDPWDFNPETIYRLDGQVQAVTLNDGAMIDQPEFVIRMPGIVIAVGRSKNALVSYVHDHAAFVVRYTSLDQSLPPMLTYGNDMVREPAGQPFLQANQSCSER